MKAISSDLRAHLASETTTICTCWKITRVDSTVIGFTDHDVDLVFEGTTYVADSGFLRTAITNTATVAPGELEAHGFLDSVILTEKDIRAGLYDYAEVQLFLVNYESLADGSLKLRFGNFGEATITSAGSFTIELRGLLQRLEQQIIETYGPRCRASLGDKRCANNGGVQLFAPVRISGHAYALGDRVSVRNAVADNIISLPLANGDFGVITVTDLVDWSLTNMAISTTRPRDGAYALTTTDWVATATQEITPAAAISPFALDNALVWFGVYCRSASTAQHSRVSLSFKNAGHVEIGTVASTYAACSTGYALMAITFFLVPPGTVSIDASIESIGVGAGVFTPADATFFDSAVFTLVPVGGSVTPVSVLSNGSFEEATSTTSGVSGWTLVDAPAGSTYNSVNNYENLPTPDSDGFYAIVFTGGLSAAGDIIYAYSDFIGLVTGGVSTGDLDAATYQIDLNWLAANIDYTGITGLGLAFYDAGGALISTVAPDLALAIPVYEWQAKKRSILVPTGARQVKFIIGYGINTVGGYKWTYPKAVVTDITGVLRPIIAYSFAYLAYGGVEYVATVAGTSDAATPTTWSRTIGDTIVDGTVTWIVTQPQFLFLVTIATVVSRGIFTFTGATLPDQWVQWGVCEVVTGVAAGFKKDIIGQVGAQVNLAFPFPYTPAPGDQVILQTGCDKKISTCFSKFANQLNFRAFPFMPGTDQYFQVGSPAG